MFKLSAPSPDISYSRLPRRGKHKIFIGMAAGVGKTYRMLEEAQHLKQEGIDVVIGILETHGRKETQEKAVGLEIIVSRKEATASSLSFPEMDTEAILARQPQLVLVDELAYTNVSGSQREKRYQDVEVILAAGIDVFSTVNIQHLEGLTDLVAKMTGVVVTESIPDRLLNEADAIVVVDVTPETLEARLLQGKIYAPEKIEQSLQNFFQRRNLIALRKLVLREVADNIEEDAFRKASRQCGNTSAPARQLCCIHERVLVCVSAAPTSMGLLRRGAEIASHMNAPLYALFVTNPERFLTKAETLHVEACERMCQEFRGKFLRVTSQNIPETVSEVAKTYHITQIVVGKTCKSRWKRLLRGSLIDRLMRSLEDIDLHIIVTKK